MLLIPWLKIIAFTATNNDFNDDLENVYCVITTPEILVNNHINTIYLKSDTYRVTIKESYNILYLYDIKILKQCKNILIYLYEPVYRNDRKCKYLVYVVDEHNYNFGYNTMYMEVSNCYKYRFNKRLRYLVSLSGDLEIKTKLQYIYHYIKIISMNVITYNDYETPWREKDMDILLELDVDNAIKNAIKHMEQALRYADKNRHKLLGPIRNSMEEMFKHKRVIIDLYT